MKLSIIIPVFNEEDSIENIIKKVEEIPLSIEKEIIVVDDGSFDKTKEILKNIKENFNFILKEHFKNKGKGAAIKTGLSAVKGDLILIQDADLEYNPQEYPFLIKPFLEEKAEIVYGSRNLIVNPRFSRVYFLGGKFLTFIFNLVFRTNLTDINTGYKIFRKNVLLNLDLKEDDFAFCEEVTCKAIKKGYKIVEIPISYNPRGFKGGKKIRWWKDGFKGLYTIIKYKIL